MIFRVSLALVALALLTSCQSAPSGPGFRAHAADLRGMVFNLDRQPVEDVRVDLMKGDTVTQSVSTDLHGRFAFGTVGFGTVSLRFSKDDHETLTTSLDFKVPSQVVYVRLANRAELLDRAADALQQRDWHEMQGFLDRVRALDPQNSVATYLDALRDLRQGQAQTAETLLLGLEKTEGPTLAVELALADVYQDSLHDDLRAMAHLRQALALRDDLDVEARLKALEDASNPAPAPAAGSSAPPQP